MSSDLKIGLALGSGSSRGWSHIGIINELSKLDIEPDIVCGTCLLYTSDAADDLYTV